MRFHAWAVLRKFFIGRNPTFWSHLFFRAVPSNTTTLGKDGLTTSVFGDKRWQEVSRCDKRHSYGVKKHSRHYFDYIILGNIFCMFNLHWKIRELRKWYIQIHIKPRTPKGKTDKYNKAATKWTDGKQSWQLFPKKVGTLNWIYNQHT